MLATKSPRVSIRLISPRERLQSRLERLTTDLQSLRPHAGVVGNRRLLGRLARHKHLPNLLLIHIAQVLPAAQVQHGMHRAGLLGLGLAELQAAGELGIDDEVVRCVRV